MRSWRPRVRLSYANVTATLALFIALGGTGYAVTKVRGKDIAPRTITAKNVKKGTLTKEEIGRGEITAAKLSRGVRSLLPDDGFGDDGPLDGRDGEPGEPGPPGDPGPAGAGCEPERELLCGDESDGEAADVFADGAVRFSVTAYRTICTRGSGCVVKLAGSAPPPSYVNDWIDGGATRDFQLRAGARTVAVDNGQPASLRDEGDHYQLTLSAADVD